MDDVEAHRRRVDGALSALGLDWEAWPEVVVDPRLTSEQRMSAVLVLLATDEGDDADPDAPFAVTVVGQEDGSLDWLGRARRPWQQLARMTLPWDPEAAATALQVVSARRSYDERRVALALRGARQVCAEGRPTATLIDSLQTCLTRLDEEMYEGYNVKEMRRLAQRVLASTAPPHLLDLSLVADGDAWAGPARDAASSAPADEVAPLVRLLGDLGPRRPSKTWWNSIDAALKPPAARSLLRRWLELAAHTDVVPEWPGSQIGDCLGALFVGTNVDVVRGAVLASSRLPDETWVPEILGVLARRGSAHNGAPGFPEALALKVSYASIEALRLRGGPRDRRVLAELHEDLTRKDLIRRVAAALD